MGQHSVLDKPLARWKNPVLPEPAWWTAYRARLRPCLATAVSELQKAGFKHQPHLGNSNPDGLGYWATDDVYAIVTHSKSIFHVSMFTKKGEPYELVVAVKVLEERPVERSYSAANPLVKRGAREDNSPTPGYNKAGQFALFG